MGVEIVGRPVCDHYEVTIEVSCRGAADTNIVREGGHGTGWDDGCWIRPCYAVFGGPHGEIRPLEMLIAEPKHDESPCRRVILHVDRGGGTICDDIRRLARRPAGRIARNAEVYPVHLVRGIFARRVCIPLIELAILGDHAGLPEAVPIRIVRSGMQRRKDDFWIRWIVLPSIAFCQLQKLIGGIRRSCDEINTLDALLIAGVKEIVITAVAGIVVHDRRIARSALVDGIRCIQNFDGRRPVNSVGRR